MLWDLLAERTPEQSISHKVMPTWQQHCGFVDSRPYEAWYLVWDETREALSPRGIAVGAVYLSRQREIGVGILRTERGQGHAQWAIGELMRLHPGRFLANISPANEPSARLFGRLGFSLIQHTYEGPSGNPLAAA